jgi:bacillithiol biosynthesis deacetylase BshB1
MTRYDVVCFAAHPDDMEFSIAGTIAKLVGEGKRVLQVVFTKAENSTHGTVEERMRELDAASKALGVDYRVLDFHDGLLESDATTHAAAARILKETRPDIVFAPYHTNDAGHWDWQAHHDHLACGKIVKEALKFARFVNFFDDLKVSHLVRRCYYYMVPADRRPTFVVDVTDAREKKLEAIKKYETQTRINRIGVSMLDLIETREKFFGTAIGAKYGEGFIVDETFRAEPRHLFEF